MAPIVLALGGAILWVASMAVVVQRQRVLHRRLARIARRVVCIELALGLHCGRPTGRASLHPVALPAPGILAPTGPPAGRPRPMPTVKHLARLAVPLQRAGG